MTESPTASANGRTLKTTPRASSDCNSRRTLAGQSSRIALAADQKVHDWESGRLPIRNKEGRQGFGFETAVLDVANHTHYFTFDQLAAFEAGPNRIAPRKIGACECLIDDKDSWALSSVVFLEPTPPY
jgi:hypothetical protein